jgi:hypothetical protein
MKRYGRKFIIVLLATFFFIMAVSNLLWAASDTEKVQETSQTDIPATSKEASEGTRLNRIDFGNTYIIGQTIKSGAVYLLQRKKSEIKSMLTYREDYRKEILEGFSIEALDEPAKEQKQIVSGKNKSHEAGRLVSKDE